MWGNNKTPFVEWLGELADTWPEWIKNPPKDRWRFAMDGIPYHHAAPQMDWLGAVSNFKKLIRFERRAADIAVVSQAIGIDIDPAIHRKRAGQPTAQHDDRTRAMVRKIYADDLRLLNY